MFLKGALSDKEKAIFNQVKEERVAQKVRQSYKKKINKVQRQLNNTISPEERRKIGYLKYKARQKLNQPSPKSVAESMIEFSKVDTHK